MPKRISWTALKDQQIRLGLPFDWIEEPTYYLIRLLDLKDSFIVRLNKDDLSDPDLIDFETNIKPNPNTIGQTNRIKVAADIDTISLGNVPCPAISGPQWRSEIETNDITLSTSSYTTLKSVNNTGTLESFTVDFSSDRVDVRLTIDGTVVFTIDLDDLEKLQPSGGSDGYGGGGGKECFMWVRTGSKFTFCPPCALKYNTNFTISAKGETNNRRKDSMITHYTVGG